MELVRASCRPHSELRQVIRIKKIDLDQLIEFNGQGVPNWDTRVSISGGAGAVAAVAAVKRDTMLEEQLGFKMDKGEPGMNSFWVLHESGLSLGALVHITSTHPEHASMCCSVGVAALVEVPSLLQMELLLHGGVSVRELVVLENQETVVAGLLIAEQSCKRNTWEQLGFLADNGVELRPRRDGQGTICSLFIRHLCDRLRKDWRHLRECLRSGENPSANIAKRQQIALHTVIKHDIAKEFVRYAFDDCDDYCDDDGGCASAGMIECHWLADAALRTSKVASLFHRTLFPKCGSCAELIVALALGLGLGKSSATAMLPNISFPPEIDNILQRLERLPAKTLRFKAFDPMQLNVHSQREGRHGSDCSISDADNSLDALSDLDPTESDLDGGADVGVEADEYEPLTGDVANERYARMADESFARRVEEQITHDVERDAADERRTCEVWLLQYKSHTREFYDALVNGSPLRHCRDALANAGRHCVLPTSEAKIFIRPDQWTAVITALQDYKLRPYHVVVSGEYEAFVDESLQTIVHHHLRPRLKQGVGRTRITLNGPSIGSDLSGDVEQILDVRRTFLCVAPPLQDASLVTQSTQEH